MAYALAHGQFALWLSINQTESWSSFGFCAVHAHTEPYNYLASFTQAISFSHSLLFVLFFFFSLRARINSGSCSWTNCIGFSTVPYPENKTKRIAGKIFFGHGHESQNQNETLNNGNMICMLRRYLCVCWYICSANIVYFDREQFSLLVSFLFAAAADVITFFGHVLWFCFCFAFYLSHSAVCHSLICGNYHFYHTSLSSSWTVGHLLFFAYLFSFWWLKKMCTHSIHSTDKNSAHNK